MKGTFLLVKRSTTRQHSPMLMPLLFRKLPPEPEFRLEIGHKIGISVFRTFDIHHDDAGALPSIVLSRVHGDKNQTCIYTGEVTEFSSDRTTFCHSLNAFAGCSGAVVFLLDRNQPQDLVDFNGMAVGVQVVELDDDKNIDFLLKNKEKEKNILSA